MTMMTTRRLAATCFALLASAGFSPAAMPEAAGTAADFDSAKAGLDAAVEACLETNGVAYLSDVDSICYNDAIFPGQFLQLADLPAAERIIISSPGGNVATARMMSTILDGRDEPLVIAGPCMSACAMVILPGADDIQIHRSAHIAVHGIAMMGFDDWFGWLKEGEAPSGTDRMMAGIGYNFGYTMHRSGKDHMVAHLDGQDVDQAYIDEVSARMQDDALAHPCRVKTHQYWGMLDAAHLRRHLGDRISHMERFDQAWPEAGRTAFRDRTVAISETTYIFEDDYEEAGCSS